MESGRGIRGLPVPKTKGETVKKHRPFLWIAALGAASLASLPAHAGVTIDRGSPAIGACGAPVNPATVFSQMPPAAGCPVAEVVAGALGLGAADNVDGLSGNTLWAATSDFVWIFSGDRAALGQAASNYRPEAMANQAASDLWKTAARPTASPGAVIAAACGAPAAIGLPFPTQMRLQTDYRLTPFLATGVAFGGVQDNIDDFDMDDLDPSGNLVHDVAVYFSLDPASPALGGGSGAALFYTAPGAFFRSVRGRSRDVWR
jgi:hypothetical protein